ncbi:uncharacterized protein LOC132730243 isoform X2 [Ruditapes philippinarum]|uniref:uncharacterized protein LOC132730243 isoform X2 n=1 Tax=Ruditapes philippinarum TaxID=129788 RepID=UPI00295B2B63|nr:uncharacterized protein LOC132730243 isoform X2 [Ruditapes philippinarum]
MRQLKRKQSFVVPFSQAGNTNSQKIDIQSLWPRQNEKKAFSPLHIGQHVQTITPNTRKKIKQRFAMSFSRVPVRNTSPGFDVPFDLSQSSCFSQQIDVQEFKGNEEVEDCREEGTVRDVCKSTDQIAQDDGEEFDLELTEEVTNIESVVGKNRTDTEDLQEGFVDKESPINVDTDNLTKEHRDINIKWKRQNKKNKAPDTTGSDGLSTGTVTVACPATENDSDKIKTVENKKEERCKKRLNPNFILQTNIFSKRVKSKNVSKVRIIGKSVGWPNSSFGAQADGKKKRKTMVVKETTRESHEWSIEMGMSDFCPLTSLNKSKYQCDVKDSTRKRKVKQTTKLNNLRV